MGVFETNLLNDALSIIGTQEVSYYQYSGRVTTPAGIDRTTYAPPVSLVGSMQAVPQRLYHEMGLDLQRQYFYFFCSTNLTILERDVSGDLLQYGDKVMKCESATDWYAQDGWKQVLCVVTDSAAPEPATFVVTPGTVFIVEPQ